MKNIIVVLIALSIVIPGLAAGAQKGVRGQGTPQNRIYDPANVETVSGSVESVGTVVPKKGTYATVTLTLKTEKETITVHLGPQWYVAQLDTKITKGDVIEVKGSRVTFDGKPAIIAAEVKKGDNVLVLRDDAGIPVWSKRKR